jgi:hypothetical protein
VSRIFVPYALLFPEFLFFFSDFPKSFVVHHQFVAFAAKDEKVFYEIPL